MTGPNLAELIDVVVQRAPKMRVAGILVFATPNITVHLSPHQSEAPPPSEGDDQADDEEEDPMFSPATFGRRRGRVPGKQRGEK